MTPLPDWLVERAALDEVSPASRDRLAHADPRELADRIAALRDDSAGELARHPARPAVAQIEARIAAEARQRATARRYRRLGWLGLASGAAAILLVTQVTTDRPDPEGPIRMVEGDGVRVKGLPRMMAFRQAGGQAERIVQDTMVHAGDVIQLRYNAGGQRYGVIASVDGAGAVTLHYPLREDAPPEATAVAPETVALPSAYALDDAPGFERFFFVTADSPLALRELARRDDSATVLLELPAGLRQASLRLRKPDRHSVHHEPSHETP